MPYTDEDYERALAEAGIGSSGAVPPSAPAKKEEGGLNLLLKAAGYLTNQNLSNAPAYDLPAQAARLGQFANRGNQSLADGVAEAGGRGGAALERAGLPVTGKAFERGLVGTAGALGTASEFLMPQNRLGVLGYAVEPVMRGGQAAIKALRGSGASKPGMVAQIGQSRTKVPAGDIQQAIDDPSVWGAPSVYEANKAYGTAIGSLENVTPSLGKKLNKTLVSEADFDGAINRAGRLLNGTEVDEAGKAIPLTPQEALSGVQAINRYLRNKMFTAKLDKPQLGELHQLKDDLMGWMESNGTSGLRGAATTVRKAHVKENLGYLMPQNKWGGNDGLRSLAAGGELATAAATFAGGAAAGHPFVGAAAATPFLADAVSKSPAAWGAGIRNYQSLTNPSLMGRAAVAGSNLFEDEMGPQRGR
jgi:hypothetical protein